jgi:hypothetical protein
MLTTNLHLVPRLRTSGAIPPLPLQAFMACTWTVFFVINAWLLPEVPSKMWQAKLFYLDTPVTGHAVQNSRSEGGDYRVVNVEMSSAVCKFGRNSPWQFRVCAAQSWYCCPIIMAPP